jgi:hypothetical protein
LETAALNAWRWSACWLIVFMTKAFTTGLALPPPMKSSVKAVW